MSVDDDLLFDHLDYRVTASKDADEAYLDPEKFVERLTQAWINERASPDVLQYEQGSVDGLLEKIEYQTGIIDELDSGNDTSMIISILYQTELERVKFVLRSYLRTRISKARRPCAKIKSLGIEKFCQYILADASSKRRLSRAEVLYAENYAKATRQHYDSSFLSSLPPSLQGQDDTVFDRKLSMISQPRLDEAVFCRVVEDIGDFQLDE
ncbi:GINS complex subunit [Dissophora ornata]|nr:GINS complex subunit [Dissophora ornata]